MKKLLLRLVGLSWLGKIGEWLNGKKTILGVIAILIHSLHLAEYAIPECGGMCTIAAKGLSDALLWLGVVLTPIGVTHKVLKKVDS